MTGNYIGTNPAGVVDLGNLQAGVIILGEANVVGGLTPAERNIISGNNQTGVRLALGANANIIQGNFIGTDISGTLLLANGEGVSVGVIGASSASSNTIGGLTAGVGDLHRIQHGGRCSRCERWHEQRHLGQRHSAVTADSASTSAPTASRRMTPADFDEGPNERQNFPVLTGSSRRRAGHAQQLSTQCIFRIEFFGNAACDASGTARARRSLAPRR